MKLLLEEKPLKGAWWKYALALTLTQNAFWLSVGWRVNPSFSVADAYLRGWFVWAGWIVFSWLPFAAGRLGLKTLLWLGIAGFVAGDLAYATMAFFEPIRRLYVLLPYTAFVQLNIAFLSLGVLIEFGRYVYRKVFEE